MIKEVILLMVCFVFGAKILISSKADLVSESQLAIETYTTCRQKGFLLLFYAFPTSHVINTAV